jgi:hypothetical protein
MRELEAQGQEESEHELDKRLAIIHQAPVGRFILKINRHSAPPYV